MERFINQLFQKILDLRAENPEITVDETTDIIHQQIIRQAKKKSVEQQQFIKAAIKGLKRKIK